MRRQSETPTALWIRVRNNSFSLSTLAMTNSEVYSSIPKRRHRFALPAHSILFAYSIVIKIAHTIRLGPHSNFPRNRFGQGVVQQMFSIQRRLQIRSMN